MTIKDWLETKFNPKFTFLDRIAELYAVNGMSFQTPQAGTVYKVGLDTNPYGRLGLTIPEAIELAKLEGVILGYQYSKNAPEEEFQKKVVNTIVRHIQQRKKAVNDGNRNMN